MKRSLIITLALIAAIAGPLCASSGWARGLGVLALVGEGASGPTLILDDALYSSSAVNLESYTVVPGPGGSWTKLKTPTLAVSTTGAYSTSGTADLGIYCNTSTAITTTGSRVVATGTLGSTTPTRNFGVGFFRLDGTGFNVLISGDGRLFISVNTNNIASASAITGIGDCGSISTSTTYTVDAVVTGNTIQGTLKSGDTALCSVSYETTNTSGTIYPAIIVTNVSARVTDIKAWVGL